VSPASGPPASLGHRENSYYNVYQVRDAIGQLARGLLRAKVPARDAYCPSTADLSTSALRPVSTLLTRRSGSVFVSPYLLQTSSVFYLASMAFDLPIHLAAAHEPQV
jgi:hypothetical protein